MAKDYDVLKAEYESLLKQLAQVEEQNLGLMHAATDAILVVGEGGAIRFANAAAGRLLGKEAADLVGRSIGHPMDAGAETMVDILRGDGTTQKVVMSVSAGTWKGAPASTVTLRSQPPDVEAYANQLLPAFAAKYLEFTADGMIITDSRGTVICWNTMLAELTGIAEKQAVGRPLWEVLAKAASPGATLALAARARQLLADPAALPDAGFSIDEVRHHDGSTRMVATACFNMQENGERWLGCVVRDVTQQAHTEREVNDLRAANQELERAARTKDDFLAAMGHELRTPLNAVLSLSRVLRDQLNSVLSDHQRQSFEVITESGQHLLALINDILDLSKVQAGMMTLDIETVQIDTLCASALSIVRQMAEQKHLQLVEHYDEQVQSIQADPLRFKQILVNLLSNAVKFTPAGGSVGVEVDGRPDENAVIVTVWDTGIGIAAEDLDRLFKPFVQIDNSMSRLYTGTGLGLALSQRLANQHGGEISVTSVPGAGSRFAVMLPWHKEDATMRTETLPPFEKVIPPATAPRREPDGPNHKVLLAEDSEANIFAISAYLEMVNVPVLVARTGPEALALAKAEHPDMILMDLNLPRLNGLEVIRRLRSTREFEGVPIVIISALSDDNERVRASGADHFLSKPIDLDKLDDLMDRYFT